MDIILIIIFVIGFYFVQNIIHEASHLLAAKIICGYKPVDLIPWPHKKENKFYFSRCEYVPTFPRHNKEYSIHGSPVIAGMLFFIIYAFLSIFSLLFLIPMMYSLIDVLFWGCGYLFGSKYSDGKKYKNTIK